MMMSVFEQCWPMLPVVFCAFFLKSMTGFGAAIIMVSLGAMFLPVQELIPLCIGLDLLAGVALMRQDWTPGTYRYWGPLSLIMGVGAVLGALALGHMDPSSMQTVIALVVLVLGFWLGLSRVDMTKVRRVPDTPQPMAMVTVMIAGMCSGLFGIGGPPIVWFFGRRLTKEDFRRVVVPLFVVAGVASLTVYAATGLLNSTTLLRGLLCLPAWVAGMFCGGRVFAVVPQQRFGQVMGIVLCAVALKMLLF